MSLGYSRETLWRHNVHSAVSSLILCAAIVRRGDDAGQSLPFTLTMAFPPRRAPPGDQPPPPELSLVAFQGDMCFAFLFDNFVWRAYGDRWLEQAAEGRLGGLSMEATNALAHSHFGRSNMQTQVQLRGEVGYGKCLKTLATEVGKSVELGPAGGSGLVIPILVLMMHAVSSLLVS